MKKQIIQKARELNHTLKKHKEEAINLLKDDVKMEMFLQKVERKLKTIPKVGHNLAVIPQLISLVRSYILKEYTDIPISSIITIIIGLIYFISPLDIISDSIPVLGQADDLFILNVLLGFISEDLRDYRKWRKDHHLEFK